MNVAKRGQAIQNMTLHLGAPVLSVGVEISSIADFTAQRGVLWQDRLITGVWFVFCHSGALACTLSAGETVLCRADELSVFFPSRRATFESTFESTRFTLLELGGPQVVRAVLRLGYWDGFQASVRGDDVANALGFLVPQMEASARRGLDEQTLAQLERALDSIWRDCRNRSGREAFFDLVKTIHNLPLNGLTTEKVAEATSMSRSKLNQMFMSGRGERPGAYLARLKVAVIGELLSAASLSVAQIAARTGFSSASALACFFRRQVGVTPRKYQQAVEQNIIDKKNTNPSKIKQLQSVLIPQNGI